MTPPVASTDAPRFFVLDVETSGLPTTPGFALLYPAYELGCYDTARVIELACLEYDALGNELSRVSTRVAPSGKWRMSPTAQKIHGVSSTELHAGLPGVVTISVALEMLACQLAPAFESTTIPPIFVGHNIAFDWHVVAAEAYRDGHHILVNMLDSVLCHCTMHATTWMCGLLRRNGTAKWPTLGELHLHIFQEPIPHAHTALGDVHATARCFFALKNDGGHAAATDHVPRPTKRFRRTVSFRREA